MNFYREYFAARKQRIDSRISSFPLAKALINYIIIAALTMTIFYLSLIATSAPITSEEREAIDRAIGVLEEKGFEREVFLLRRAATFRGGGNWLNEYTNWDNAYAATNFPFGIITLYPDFYFKAVDDTERAMILLHEARHLQGGDERDAYKFVWENRERLGWTILKYGTTASFVTIEQQTRENAPELFTCAEKLFDDCTVNLQKRRGSMLKAEKAERSNAKNKRYRTGRTVSRRRTP